MAITTEEKYLLNNQMGAVAAKVQLGTLIETAEDVSPAADSVGNAQIADDAVSLEHLDSGIEPSHVVKFAARYTTAGGAAAEAITLTGALSTDLSFVRLVDNGTNNVSISSWAMTANTLTVTFSGDPGADTIIEYMLLRAAA